MSQQTHEVEKNAVHRRRSPLVGLICSSCGLGFSSEEELRNHQVVCRSTFDFLRQLEGGGDQRRVDRN